MHCGDVGATLEPNGNVLILTQGAKNQTASAFVEYIPTPNSIGSFGPVLAGAPAVSGCNLTRMLLLPNGHGLIFVASSGNCYDLTFSTGGNPSWAPTITSFPATVEVNTTVPLSGI